MPVTKMGFAEHDAETLRDNALISENPSYFFSLHKAQVTGRPVAELGKLMASLLCGDDPRLLHIAMISLHMLAAILLAILLRQMQVEWPICFVASLLFLTNIGHFYAVYHFSGMDYPLALSLILLGMICFIQLGPTNNKIWLIGCFLFFGLSILSHIGAIAVLPFCLQWSLLRGYTRRQVAKNIVPLSIFLIGLSIIALKLTPQHTNTARSLDTFTPQAASFDSLVSLANQLFWFTSKLLTFSHVLTRSWHGREIWELYLGAGIVAILLVLILKKLAPLAAWSVWTLAALMPFVLIEDAAVLGWPEVMSRYIYLATAGSSVCIAYAIYHLSRLFGERRALYPLLAVLLIYSYAGLRDLDNYYLYRAGYYIWIDGDKQAGIAQVEQAIAQGGDILPIGSIYFRLCNMILSVGDPVDSILAVARTALPQDDRLLMIEHAIDSLDPNTAIAQQAKKAIENEFQQNIAIGGAAEERFREMTSTIYRFTGHNFYIQRQWQQAANAYEIAAKLSASNFANGIFTTRYAYALTQLGIALAQHGEFDSAIEYFRRATLLQPTVSTYYNMGRALKEQKAFAPAIESYKKGLLLEPNNIIILNSLGVVELEIGNIATSIEIFSQVIAIEPNYAPAQQNFSALTEFISDQ